MSTRLSTSRRRHDWYGEVSVGRAQVCVHAAEVRLAPGDRRAGGAIFRTAEWVRETPDGFFVTLQALE